MREHRVEIRIVDGSDAWEGIKAEAKRLNLSTNNVCQILCIDYFENKYRVSQGLEPTSSILSSSVIPITSITEVEVQKPEIHQNGLEAIKRAMKLQ